MATDEKAIKKLELSIDQVTRTKSLLNQNQVQKLFNSTPKRYQYDRPAKGGGRWVYVRASYVRQVLDAVFGFNWSFEIETGLAEAFEVAKVTKVCVVKGVLTARVKSDGMVMDLVKTQFGRSEVKFRKNKEGNPTTEPLDFGNDMKAATSDALKKCASLFGIAADIYDPEEFIAIEITGSDEASERNKLIKEKTKAAQEAIKAQAKAVGGENE